MIKYVETWRGGGGGDRVLAPIMTGKRVQPRPLAPSEAVPAATTRSVDIEVPPTSPSSWARVIPPSKAPCPETQLPQFLCETFYVIANSMEISYHTLVHLCFILVLNAALYVGSSTNL